jgi:4-amino-4-deoxy-L-arabinose transferase-like glycosyltransferase
MRCTLAGMTNRHRVAQPYKRRSDVAGGEHLRAYLLLVALTLLCLMPFLGKAFHADDTLFLLAAQQIVKHPLDPYGFTVIWYTKAMPMSAVTKNPPIASYYLAVVGRVAGWSERVLHLAFLLPALVVVLGTYRLAQRFTPNPLVAAAATLLTPGFLVSSTNVMCDTMMLALWLAAIILWLEGVDRTQPLWLAISGLLVALCALTKYFGMTLIPLLLAYTLLRQRRFGSWILYLLLPILVLVWYQHWTHALYGRGLISDAADYARTLNVKQEGSRLARMLIGLAFTGGCALTSVTFIPLLWRRSWIAAGVGLAALTGIMTAMGWIEVPASDFAHQQWNWVSAQLAFFILGGISTLGLAIEEWWRRPDDPGSALLSLWTLGTFVFTALVNWTINARSVLPLIPALGILIARRVDSTNSDARGASRLKLAVPLLLAGIVSFWIAWADAELANSARDAALYVRDNYGGQVDKLSFGGHWGFHYYMQKFGFNPLDADNYEPESGSLVVIPQNNTNTFGVDPQVIAARKVFQFEMKAGAATMQRPMGAGFYSTIWGPLPYAFGSVAPERYVVLELNGGTR